MAGRVVEEGRGVAALLAEIARHRAFQETDGRCAQRRRRRLRQRVLQLVPGMVAQRIWTPGRLASLQRTLDASDGTGISVHAVARAMADDFLADA